MGAHEDEYLGEHRLECQALSLALQWRCCRARRGGVVPCEWRKVEDEGQERRRAERMSNELVSSASDTRRGAESETDSRVRAADDIAEAA